MHVDVPWTATNVHVGSCLQVERMCSLVCERRWQNLRLIRAGAIPMLPSTDRLHLLTGWGEPCFAKVQAGRHREDNCRLHGFRLCARLCTAIHHYRGTAHNSLEYLRESIRRPAFLMAHQLSNIETYIATCRSLTINGDRFDVKLRSNTCPGCINAEAEKQKIELPRTCGRCTRLTAARNSRATFWVPFCARLRRAGGSTCSPMPPR